MKPFSKRAIFVVATVTGAWLASIAFATGAMPTLYAQQPSSAQVAAATPNTPQMSEQVFKNVQVLKGIPVDQFMGTMGVFTTSLSLCCGNCHTGAGTSNPKWEDDPPRKRTARAMIRMVQNINNTSFGGRQVVTCWTCHRGQLSPAVTPPLDFAYGDAVVVPPDVLPRATSGGVPTVDELFNKYVEAIGGAAKANALRSYVAHGRSLLFGEVGAGNPAEIYAEADGRVATFVHQQEGDVVRAYDGMKAWWQIPLTVTPQYPLTSTLLEGAKFDAEMAFPWKIKSFFTNWRVSFGQAINGQDVNVVQGSTPSGMIGTLYFDKKTGLLKRYIRYANTMVGRIPTQVDYDDYRDVAGVKMPFKYSYAWVSERDDWTLTSYDANATIDAKKFGRPDPKTAGDVAERKAQ